MKWFVRFWKWVWKQLRDKVNLTIFAIVVAVLSIEVWLPCLISIITGNKWLWSVGVAFFVVWQLPGTPFIAICLGITFGVRKIYDKILGYKRQSSVRLHNRNEEREIGEAKENE